MVEPTKHVLLTGAFWADTLERVVTAVASVALGLLGTEVVDPSRIDWSSFLWTLLFTAVVRILLCILARSTGDTAIPSASFFLTSGRKIAASVPPAGEGPVNGPVAPV